MSKYEVVRPWFGVKKGSVVELKEVSPSLISHVRKISDDVELTVATPNAGADKNERKAKIQARLTELGIDFKGNMGVDKLSELLPDGELEKLFSEE
ncbi:hypothetical protein I2492_15515 [Budviciaceae bacterium CWB-B4]|uniref:Uncharacterized protein n=1 Tax=Limnobaculum xujianqingii TaxID=2738837 RepID=A0A9D7AKR2_9GAMM|nr:hypothetical protein [Limnobaculum xujianqingii]MBK5074605.1 hypothetical protein [Limnobaculum xujianqingii]MBK5177729.1 hypothetical protein [Limnobaculum xujianqingii]